MEVTASSRDRAMAERRLDQMDRRSAIESVRGMGMAQPMRTDCIDEASAPSSLAENATNATSIEGPAAARRKNQFLRAGVSACRNQLRPHR